MQKLHSTTMRSCETDTHFQWADKRDEAPDKLKAISTNLAILQ